MQRISFKAGRQHVATLLEGAARMEELFFSDP
jgi:hypothetical protein